MRPWVNAEPCLETEDRYIGEWYDDVAVKADVFPIVLAAGESATNIDFELDATGLVTGTITRSDGGPASGACAKAVLAIGDGPSFGGCADADGKYEIIGITPGSYNVYFGASTSGSTTTTRGSKDLAAAFDIGYNDHIESDAELIPAGHFYGQVLTESAEISQACVYLTDLAGAPLQTVTTTSSDPFYEFAAPTGTYRLFVEDAIAQIPDLRPCGGVTRSP